MLSVIIPNYNKEAYLKLCIKSVIESCEYSKKEYEIIVIDDCSTDNSREIISACKHENLHFYGAEKNYGICHIRNKGIELAKYENIFFVDSDVILDTNAITNMMRYREKADIIFPLVAYEDGTHMTPRNEQEKLFPKMATLFLINKQSLLKKNISFDPNYFFFLEDEDFFTQCKLNNMSALYCPELLAFHPKKDFNPSAKVLFYRIRNRFLFYKKYRNIYNLSLVKTIRASMREFYLGIFKVNVLKLSLLPFSILNILLFKRGYKLKQ